jgi:hypothetical protein
MTDYKGLCRELVLLDQAEPGDYADWRQAWNAAIERACAALAEPEPEWPTDEELLAAQDQAVASFPPIHPEAEPLSAVEYARELEIRKARAVLARWGHPALPIPVSERLPGPEDCDAEGRCWWLKQRENPDYDLLMPTWHFQRQGPAGTRFFRYTHWLPAHALPVPSHD